MLITACENKKASFSPDDYLHVIDLNKTVAEIKFSELLVSATPIVLETTNESLIGTITKVIATPEYLIVLDGDIANALFLFKKDGTFVHKFGHIGNGPGEYSMIWDFCYDNTTGTVYMLDWGTNRVNLYDIHTGSFLKSIQLQYNNNSFSQYLYYQNGDLYTDLKYFDDENKNEQYLLSRRNLSTGEIEESWFDLKTYSKNIDYPGSKHPFLFGNGNSFKFNTFFMDGIMSVENGEITPFLCFTPEYTVNMADLKKLDKNIDFMVAFHLSVRNKVHNINAYFEHKDLILLDFFLTTYAGAVTIKKVIYNQKTRESKYVTGIGDLFYKENDSDSDIPKYGAQFIGYDDNGLYATQYGQTVSNLKKLLDNDLINENFKSAIANMEDDANPFLLYYEFKD